MRFSGRVALVTGASSGIGAAVAQALLDEGASVFAVGGRNVPKFVGVDLDARMDTFRCDLTDGGMPAEVVRAAWRRFGGHLDILVNAAGLLRFENTSTTTDYGWADTLALNLTVPFQLIRASIPELSISRGSIVNISSINSTRPFPNTLAYSVSKAGLDQLTRCAAIELAPHGIRVNAVNPAVVATDLHKSAGMDAVAYHDFLMRSLTTHPLGRVGTAREVADAVLFLAASSWITGVCLSVDGGRSLTVVR